VSVSPVEELRWLEYGQRLVTRHRNISASTATPSSGETLYARALAGGTAAAGGALAAFAPGHRADFVVLDDASPLLAGRTPQQFVDTWLFAGNANLVRDVFVGGSQLVRNGVHRDREAIATRYREVMRALLA
jgi:formimidoylglutamate deiminase